MPYQHYQYPKQNYPPHIQMNQQPYPPHHPNMLNQHGHWQPPYQAGATGQNSATKNVVNYFKKDDGKFDFDKVMDTAGQVANTYQQVSPLVKGISSFFTGG